LLKCFFGVERVMQQWLKDRDRLVEEGLAFIQTLAGAKRVRIESPTQVEPPKAVDLTQIAKPRDKLFERDEIRQRVADFKATQHRFQREREEYYEKTMAKIVPSRNEV
jgi:hypothetical protein